MLIGWEYPKAGYYTYDARGSVSGVTDDKGMIWQSYRYSVSGEITFGKPQYNNVYSYNAESYNLNMDVQYLRARYYSVGTANFLTEDNYLGDITDPLSLNRYNYVKSSPLNYMDPRGLASQKISENQLREELLSNYQNDIGMKWRRVYSGSEAIDIILEYDNIIQETANQYGLKPSYIQAVLFREIYCIGYEDDLVADSRVELTYGYYVQLEVYNNSPWWSQILQGGPPLPPVPGLYSLDSSTGLGQIFGSTAIKANNWAVDVGILDGDKYDVNDVYQRMDMWERLKHDDEFNINMVGLVLMYEAERLGYANLCTLSPEQGKRVIGNYNGNLAYGELVYKYVDIFDKYNR